MTVFGTQMHIIIFLISLFELVFFCYQSIFYLSRPSDKNRLYYLILLYLLIQYNVLSGIFPDKTIDINIINQYVIAYSVALIMSMYFPFYFYKIFNLKKLKFYAYGGSLLFLLAPFIFFFIIPYYITHDIELCRKWLVVVPLCYALSFLYVFTKAIYDTHKKNKLGNYSEEITGILAVIFWIALPIKMIFQNELNEILLPVFHNPNGSKVLAIILTNFGVLIMTILFIRRNIKQSKSEFNELLELNKDLTLKVKERTQELEFVHEQQTNTFINLAHEMKTPLMLLSNYVDDYIQKNDPSEELRMIKVSTDKLSKDIVNLFDLGKIEKGIELYNHNQMSDFTTILVHVVALFKPYAAKKNIDVAATIANNIHVQADPDSLYRIVFNIVENAIKFTKDAGKIEILLVHTDENEIRFSVKDNGIGLSTDSNQRLFEPYFQIRSEKNNNQGIGIGLTIVKRIVDSLNGKITITSSDSIITGTTIMIDLPLKVSCESNGIVAYYPSGQGQSDIEALAVKDSFFSKERLCVLLVEDNIALINYMGQKLQEKYNIYIALNASEAISKLETIEHLDIIVSDLMMDDGNGFDLYQSIIEKQRFDHLPFIFITASIAQKDKIKALKLGAIDFIQKPFPIHELIFKIDSILQNIEKQKYALIDSAYKALRKVSTQSGASKSANSFESLCIQYNLTTREIEIVREISKGKTYKNIANELSISDKTVAKHIQNIFEKVSVTRQAELLNKLGL